MFCHPNSRPLPSVDMKNPQRSQRTIDARMCSRGMRAGCGEIDINKYSIILLRVRVMKICVCAYFFIFPKRWAMMCKVAEYQASGGNARETRERVHTRQGCAFEQAVSIFMCVLVCPALARCSHHCAGDFTCARG